MRCPKCGGVTRIIDSRESKASIYRRRRCGYCRERFTTREIPEELFVKMSKYRSRLKEFAGTVLKVVMEESDP